MNSYLVFSSAWLKTTNHGIILQNKSKTLKISFGNQWTFICFLSFAHLLMNSTRNGINDIQTCKSIIRWSSLDKPSDTLGDIVMMLIALV